MLWLYLVRSRKLLDKFPEDKFLLWASAVGSALELAGEVAIIYCLLHQFKLFIIGEVVCS